jgi:SpoIID/LytB domain protein
MSQYGAYGRAANGATATRILKHYYSNTGVRAKRMPHRIRVGLLQYQSEIKLSSSAYTEGGGRVVWSTAGTLVARGGAGSRWRVEPSPTGGMRLYKNGDRVVRNGISVFGSPAAPLKLKFERHSTIVHVADNGREYRQGVMEFDTYPTNSCSAGFCIRLVVVLSMQKYLYGLAEVPSSWPQAALQSQAIAGRTYAFEKVKRSGQHRFPCDCAVYDSTLDQAYAGDEKRTGSGPYWDDWKRAVDATKGVVILHNGNPIQALYSSSSGGHTEHNENVWGDGTSATRIAYLRGVPDGPDDNSANPNHTWRLRMSWREFSRKLNAEFNTGRLRRFSVVKPRGVSGRVTVVHPNNTGGVRLRGVNRTVRADGWEIRTALSLKDTLFWVKVTYTVAARLASEYETLSGAPGDAVSNTYGVPRGAADTLGLAQNFDVGRMTWVKATDAVVWQWGRVLRKYDRLGGESSSLGMPRSGVWGPGSYYSARYEHGMIVWSETFGSNVVARDFAEAYRRHGAVKGALGAPATGRQSSDSLPDGGRRQLFSSGALYRNPRTGGVFALWGDIFQSFLAMGEASGACGYPTGDMTRDGNAAQAAFEFGTISVTDGSVQVDC